MKQCPQCSAEYSDNISFCAKDGKSLVTPNTTPKQLCPYCANSIEENASSCPFCKADLVSQFVPQWLKRDEALSEPGAAKSVRERLLAPKTLIWPAVVLVAAVAAFLIGGRLQHAQMLQLSQGQVKELQAKDQMIQSLEKQLEQTRQESKDNSTQLAEAKAKLEESEKNLSTTQQRLNAAKHETDRLSASQSQTRTRTVSRPADPLPSAPPPQRRVADAGLYETTRATAVYEDPSSSARVVSQINKGTRINVVNSTGDWLEVRSKHGKPPGFVRADDARIVNNRVN